ncbi:hypothetical protein XBO1_1300096 [Xenorhabdus bovienii str. oregonense]|uniref:Uncharacterized protein n=1 Tax=Xenorhabdus bovienii str. oregonense TaxID=1398202 RepID=A0A077NQX3_XENBV|nr:hypothetical protein XBO1_1300096 [Xenorhabdus bovienii str. oregonense]
MSYAVKEFADDDKIDFKREAYFSLLFVDKKLSLAQLLFRYSG